MRFLRTYKVIFLMIFFVLYVPIQSFSQSDSISNSFQSSPITIKDPISNIRLGGYFRYLGYVRNFNEMYDLDIPTIMLRIPSTNNNRYRNWVQRTNDDDFNIW